MGMAAPRARRLNPDAVPTIFAHTQQARAPKRRVHTEARLERMEKKKKTTVRNNIVVASYGHDIRT